MEVGRSQRAEKACSSTQESSSRATTGLARTMAGSAATTTPGIDSANSRRKAATAGSEWRDGDVETKGKKFPEQTRSGGGHPGGMSPKETIEILYLNARSLVKKIDELSATVVEINPDIILVTETWCNDRVSTPYLNINGYRIELRLDRSDTSNGIGGGIIVYIKSDLTILPNDKTEVNFNQFLSFRIQQQNKDSPTDIYVIYRSPNSNESNDMELCRLVSNLESDSVLIGDFNYPRINWTNMTADKKSKLFLDTVQDKLLYQYVDFSTHIAGNTRDLVLSNNSDLGVSGEE